MSRYKDQAVDKRQQILRDMAGMTIEQQNEYLIKRLAGTEVLLGIKEQQAHQVMVVNKSLEENAFTDPLTGLHNFRYLSSVAPALMETATPEDPSEDKKRINSLVEVFIDVNGLGAMNKQYGDEYGDKLLQIATGELKKHFRRATDLMAHDDKENLIACNEDKESIIIRKGGDEIVLLLQDVSIEFIEDTMQKVNNSASGTLNNHRIDAKCSFGYAVYTGQKDFSEMHAEADRKMQTYKKTAPKSQVIDLSIAA